MELETKVIHKIVEQRKRVGIIGVGILTNYFLGNAFDYLLYPFAIWNFGPLWGGLIMTGLSILVCLLLIIFYDWAKKDWLGIETVKQLREYIGSSKIRKFIAKILQKGDLAVMILLSIQFDPLITTLYMRKGVEEYQGMKSRDWKIFFGSAVIGNIFWVVVVTAGVSIVRYIKDFFVL